MCLESSFDAVAFPCAWGIILQPKTFFQNRHCLNLRINWLTLDSLKDLTWVNKVNLNQIFILTSSWFTSLPAVTTCRVSPANRKSLWGYMCHCEHHNKSLWICSHYEHLTGLLSWYMSHCEAYGKSLWRSHRFVMKVTESFWFFKKSCGGDTSHCEFTKHHCEGPESLWGHTRHSENTQCHCKSI